MIVSLIFIRFFSWIENIFNDILSSVSEVSNGVTCLFESFPSVKKSHSQKFLQIPFMSKR